MDVIFRSRKQIKKNLVKTNLGLFAGQKLKSRSEAPILVFGLQTAKNQFITKIFFDPFPRPKVTSKKREANII